MFFIKEYVNASSIWPTAKDHTDLGYIAGYVRGYNVEVATSDGENQWLTCSWIDNTPEQEFDDEFHRWYYAEHNWKPTGRICFRGYGVEEYDSDERDTFIKIVED